MEVRTISKEMIKPSSPTPHHLKTHKISLLDQLAPDIYYPFVFFYPGVVTHKNTTKIISHLLKKSLSETLTHYYPLAGRVRDDFSVSCDDHGVPFIETLVANNMSEVLKSPEIDTMEQLLPFKPHEKLSTQVNLGVQINYFGCGGVAIGVCYKHITADAIAAIYFFVNWAKVHTCGNSSDVIQHAVFDCRSSFPPHDLIPSISRRIQEKTASNKCITKRFTFDSAKVATLREMIYNESGKEYRPTRFEVVCALIWGALIAIDSENDYPSPVATIPVNLRNRVNPPLPQYCIGNVFHAVLANWPEDKAIDYKGLARTVRESVKMVNDDFVRVLFEGGVFVNHFVNDAEKFVSNSKFRIFGFTGPVGLPYYEVDFGWGKPVWVSTVMRLSNTATIVDTSDGKGIEAWIGLPIKDMPKFEQDLGILTYSSFNPIFKSKI